MNEGTARRPHPEREAEERRQPSQRRRKRDVCGRALEPVVASDFEFRQPRERAQLLRQRSKGVPFHDERLEAPERRDPWRKRGDPPIP